MRLTIDIGNTSITAGYFNKNKLVHKTFLPTAKFKTFKLSFPVQDVIYASVVPKVDKYFQKYFKNTMFRALSFKNIKNISVSLKNKKEIGIDRLVNAAGVVELYKAPAIIIDFGTATTFCIVDPKKVYQGGLICPGINLTRQVLHEKTAKLPLVNIIKPKALIGKNTISAMQSGIFFGYQSLVEGLLQRLQSQFGKHYKVIATGGYARLITQGLKQKIDIIDPELTLKSLNLLGNNS